MSAYNETTRAFVAELGTPTPNKVLRLWLTYQKEDYVNLPRGYYLSVHAVTVNQPDGRESIVLGLGARVLIEKTARKSVKRLTQLADELCLDDYRHVIDHVLERNDLALWPPYISGISDSVAQEVRAEIERVEVEAV